MTNQKVKNLKTKKASSYNLGFIVITSFDENLFFFVLVCLVAYGNAVNTFIKNKNISRPVLNVEQSKIKVSEHLANLLSV